DVGPTAVQVRGAPSLLNDAVVQATDPETGEVMSAVWDRRLLDNGDSNDSNPSDRIFAQKVLLADGKHPPRAHEMVFFQLAFGEGPSAWFLEFPYIFPPLKPSAVTANYEPTTRTVLLLSNPFGEVLDFSWSINLYNSTGLSVWSSQPLSGRTTRQFS